MPARGSPGLPLAIALPAASIDLVEATRRKCEVIDRLALAAGAENARSVAARAESLGHADYDVVTARALAPLGVLAEYAAPLLSDEGVLLAWKGEPEPGEESVGAAVAMEFDRALPVQPFPAARSRRLVVLRKTGPTPPGFPRRPGMARKRPLA